MFYKSSNLINENKSRLLELGISVDEIKSSELNFKEEAVQVDLFNETLFTRITLFKSNRLYIHILDITSEETIHFWDNVLDNDADIRKFIMDAIGKMVK